MRPNNNGKGRFNRLNGNNGNKNNRHNGQQSFNKNTVFDSSGPCGRIRGTAIQIADRYLQAAKDAQASDDIVLAENCTQHSEHYMRMYLNACAAEQERFQQRQQQMAEQAEQEEASDVSSTVETPDADLPLKPQEKEQANTLSGDLPAFLQAPVPEISADEEPALPEKKPAKPRTPRKPRKTEIETASEEHA